MPLAKLLLPESASAGPLSVVEERRLARRWRTLNDEKALARLVSAHLRLVIHIAGEFRYAGPPFEDLVQEGNLGLVIAARRFDPNRKTRLATYATYWIRACMLEHVVRSHGPVRIGTTRSQRKIFFGLGRARRALERAGAAVDSHSLAHQLGVEAADVEAMAPRLSSRDVSLDAPRSGDQRRPLGADVALDQASPEEVVARREEGLRRRLKLRAGLEVLDSRERAIIQARHLRRRPATLSALGRRFGVSRERVRQLELRAKAKLCRFVGVPAAAGR